MTGVLIKNRKYEHRHAQQVDDIKGEDSHVTRVIQLQVKERL